MEEDIAFSALSCMVLEIWRGKHNVVAAESEVVAMDACSGPQTVQVC